ncbi:FAD-binding oxidoreductase [Erwiniaceae bacterium BAC15a-03b]|uniref:FAD-binding oxidoreductase n=1 Tax=Winslowiella arboricola TaxID=2978220 RepID=A0A9J6PS93_9GAMM|nr:FAD-binding oxidoreductase [Winslowiella arboricola]MCU5775273.1 FAD-binding oxidoreductase [Winslowiella arboricola]MCU5780330.1 FAD-binding oxidoreductase [Winslowiella arboricola]
MTQNKRVAVIGAGVLGLSVARSLALAGAKVTIFERDHIGAGTSTTTYAWVNSNGKSPESYHHLNVAAMHEHQKLQQQASSEGRWLIKSGTCEWATDAAQQEKLHTRVSKLLKLNYPAQAISREQLKTRVPEIRLEARAGEIWHFPEECLLFPTIFLAHLWEEARQHGAQLHTNCDVIDIQENEQGAKLELANGEIWQGDSVVLATGRWSQALMASLGLQLALIDANQPNKIACGFIATTAPLLTQLQTNLITPALNVRPDGGGRLLLQAPDLDHLANPAAPPNAEGWIGQEMLSRLRRTFDNMDSARIERIAIGQRSRPADGLPGIGYVTPQRRVYLMVTHSGMTLAPLLGRLGAEEVIHDRRSALLDDFAPDRLLGKSAQDFPAFSTLHFPAAQ